MSSVAAATVACLTFIALFGFGQLADLGNYNFVTPYSHALTHGVLLSVATIFAFICYLRSSRCWPAGIIGLALGLTFLTKAEVFVAVAPAIACGLDPHTLAEPEVRRQARGSTRSLLEQASPRPSLQRCLPTVA